MLQRRTGLSHAACSAGAAERQTRAACRRSPATTGPCAAALLCNILHGTSQGPMPPTQWDTPGCTRQICASPHSSQARRDVCARNPRLGRGGAATPAHLPRTACRRSSLPARHVRSLYSAPASSMRSASAPGARRSAWPKKRSTVSGSGSSSSNDCALVVGSGSQPYQLHTSSAQSFEKANACWQQSSAIRARLNRDVGPWRGGPEVLQHDLAAALQ